MHRLDTKNPWSYSHGFNMMVDFCIWVLESDGLHVPPFEQHPDGDGSLRAVGLDAGSWRAWLERVVSLQYEQQQAFQQQAMKIQQEYQKTSQGQASSIPHDIRISTELLDIIKCQPFRCR